MTRITERSHYVAGTRWWPPFCAAVDLLVAAGHDAHTRLALGYTGHGLKDFWQR
jgi:hypothetical protein